MSHFVQLYIFEVLYMKFDSFLVLGLVWAVSLGALSARAENDNVFSAAPLGVGAGLMGESNSKTAVAGAMNATFAVRYSTPIKSDSTGRQTGIAFVSADVFYNVIGVNSSARATTSIGIRFDGGAFGDFRVRSDKCGFYAGASGTLDSSIWANQPGSNSVDASIGPETGLYCHLDNGLTILISPSMRIHAGYSDFTDNTTHFSAKGVAAGLVARFVLSEKFASTFRMERTLKSFVPSQIDEDGVTVGSTMTRASADLNIRMSENWMLSFFVKYLRLESGIEKDPRYTLAVRIGGNIIRTF